MFQLKLEYVDRNKLTSKGYLTYRNEHLEVGENVSC